MQSMRVLENIIFCSLFTNRLFTLVHASIWSCHLVVRYNLFGLLGYSAEHRKSFFFKAAAETEKQREIISIAVVPSKQKNFLTQAKA